MPPGALANGRRANRPALVTGTRTRSNRRRRAWAGYRNRALHAGHDRTPPPCSRGDEPTVGNGGYGARRRSRAHGDRPARRSPGPTVAGKRPIHTER